MKPDTRIAAGAANVALFTIPALGAVAWITLPAPANPAHGVTELWRAGVGSWTNYLQFAVFGVLMAVAFLAGYLRGMSVIVALFRALSGETTGSRTLRRALWCAVGVGALAYAVNASISSVTHPLTDAFHEGEYLGFIPTLRDGGSLADALTTHGPGVDLVPAYASVALAGPDNGIAVARLAYALLRAAAVFAALACLAFLCRLFAPEDSRSGWVVTTALAVLVLGVALRFGEWPDEPPMHKTLNARDAVYLVQVALSLAFARAMSVRPRASRAGPALAFLFGATLPWAPYYSYDRGLYGLAFAALVSLAMTASPWRRAWLGGLLAGAAAGLVALFALVPRHDLAAAAEQIRYWMTHGRDLWSFPGIATPPEPWIPILLAGAAISIAAAVAIAVKSLREYGRGVVVREPAAVVMLAASLPLLRTAIERGDGTHVAWAVTPAWMFIAAGLARAARVRFAKRDVPSVAVDEAAAIWAVLVSALVGYMLSLMNPAAAWARIDREILRGVRTADASVLSAEEREVQRAMAPAVRKSPCFVTLTNQPTWYYILGRPSCARFLAATNARPAEAQAEFVAALEAKRPEWILLGNRDWSNVVDGVSFFDASPAVATYVLTHYVPDKLVAGNGFWRRASGPPVWSQERIGSATIHPAIASRRFDASLRGTLTSEQALHPPSALLLTADEPPRPLWAGVPDGPAWRGGAWSVTLPTAALPAGTHRLQAWARRDTTAEWVRLGEAVDVRIE